MSSGSEQGSAGTLFHQLFVVLLMLPVLHTPILSLGMLFTHCFVIAKAAYPASPWLPPRGSSKLCCTSRQSPPLSSRYRSRSSPRPSRHTASTAWLRVPNRPCPVSIGCMPGGRKTTRHPAQSATRRPAGSTTHARQHAPHAARRQRAASLPAQRCRWLLPQTRLPALSGGAWQGPAPAADHLTARQTAAPMECWSCRRHRHRRCCCPSHRGPRLCRHSVGRCRCYMRRRQWCRLHRHRHCCPGSCRCCCCCWQRQRRPDPATSAAGATPRPSAVAVGVGSAAIQPIRG